MNKIILCEGETDAILLSYYLDKVAGWKFCKKVPSEVAIKTDAYDMEQGIDALLVVIPTEHQGALETLMMDSIAEDPYDAVIVKKAGEFVGEMKPVASKYIDGRRKEIKAHLGVTWAIQYPEKVFKLMNEQIRSVEWEKSEVLRECFEQLIKI